MLVAKKLWFLLDRKLRSATVVLSGLMLAGMLLETLGVGLVVPALALITQQDPAAKYPAIAPWLGRLSNPTREQLVIFSMLFLVSVYAVKSLFLALLAWRQSWFAGHLQSNLGLRLFAGYLRQPYAFHLQRNSAQLIRNVIQQSSALAATFQQGLVLLTEVLVMLGVSVMLLIIEPVGALVVVIALGLAGWGFLRVTRRKIVRWGRALHRSEGLRLQIAQEAFGGIKDVLLLGRAHAFLSQFEHHNVLSADAIERHSTTQALPRLWLELLAVVGLASLVLVMLGMGRSIDALLPALGLFAAAAFRLIPSVNRILASIQVVRFALPVIDTLYDEIRAIEESQVGMASALPNPIHLTRNLTLDRIGFAYPGAERPALVEISLSIPRGASVGFVGESGAGKSTLVDIILGLLEPTGGTVLADGVDLQSALREWQNQIGYVPQAIYLSDDTLRHNVAFGLADGDIDDEALWRAIRAAQLEELVGELPLGLNTVVGERGVRLSGGQRQRIGIARALYHDPAILVLDEATSSLDTNTERSVMEAVRALRGAKTVIIVAHRLSTVEHCDPVFRLERGRIVDSGSFADVTRKLTDFGGQAESTICNISQ